MSQTVVQGSAAVLDCPIHGDPSPVLQWLRDGRALLRSHRIQALLNGSLLIYSINVNTLFFPTVVVIIVEVFLNILEFCLSKNNSFNEHLGSYIEFPDDLLHSC